MDSQKPVKDCYNCMKRRIRCDKTEPSCKKCEKKKLSCPGYGIRYRFALNNNDAEENALLKRSAVPIPASLEWIEWNRDQLDEETFDDLQQDAEDVELVLRPDESAIASSRLDFNPLPYVSLQPFDAQTRFLLDHFSHSVSPVMVVFDGEANGYRKLILPMAVEDENLRRAVMVAAASHLRNKMPQLKSAAEGGRKAVIQKLRDLSQCNDANVATVFNDVTWATILVLVVGDLITAHEDILILYKMLRTFLRTWDRTLAESSSSSFLRYQSKLIGFFASATMTDSEAISHFSSEFELLTWYEVPTMDSATDSNVETYGKSFNNARKIYLARVSSPFSSLQANQELADLVSELQTLLLQLDQSAPGAHVLVWPYFVAAAESTEYDTRERFKERLEYIWRTTGYANVRVATDMLQEIWARQSWENWTTILTEHCNIIM